MSSTPHTPGPWRAEPRGPFDEFGKVTVTGAAPKRGSRRGHVAEVWNGSTGDPHVAVANARLVAAAPDMLDALRHLLETMETPRSRKAMAAWIIARAAISKATGEA